MLAISLPMLAEYGFLPIPGVEDARALWVGVAAGFILLLEGLQHLNKWQENWILYRSTCEGLRHEQHLFFEKAGPYAGLKPELAQRLLAHRRARYGRALEMGPRPQRQDQDDDGVRCRRLTRNYKDRRQR